MFDRLRHLSAPDRLVEAHHLLAGANLRRYLLGYWAAMSGALVYLTALAWLVLESGGGARDIAVVGLAKLLPVTVVAPLGGRLADRLDKRTILACTSILQIVNALALWALAERDAATLPVLAAINAVAGVLDGINQPTGNAIVGELVDRDEQVATASALMMLASRSARIVGPLIAGATIALAGTAVCFAVHAVALTVMLVGVLRIDRRTLRRPLATRRAASRHASTLRYIASDRRLWIALPALAVCANVSYTFESLLSVLAKETLSGDAETYAGIASIAGAGAVAGAVVILIRRPGSLWSLVPWAVAFGAAEMLIALAPTKLAVQVLLFGLGAAAVGFVQTAIGIIQAAVAPEYRGRVMGLVAVAVVPLGSPAVGWIADVTSPPAALVLVGAVMLALAAAVATAITLTDRRTAAAGAARPPAG